MPKNRNAPPKPPKPIFHIFCEGKESEPNYLESYLGKFHSNNRLLKVIKIESSGKNTAKELVEEAVKKKLEIEGKNFKEDLFWVAYDRESEQKYPDNFHAIAYINASKNDVQVALSNVCFEVWLLLHFELSSKPYLDCDDLIRNSNFLKNLRKENINSYKKADKKIFKSLEDKICSAKLNAIKMNEQTKQCSKLKKTQPYQLNPYTDFYKLLDKIDEFASLYLK